MLNGLSSSVAIGGYPKSGGLDQLPQSLAQIRRLIERVPAVDLGTTAIKRPNGLIGFRHSVAHLTEAIEELVNALDGGTAPSATRIRSHLRDVRENFNQVAPRPAARSAPD